MKNLGINWITEYTTDFEYKKYLLLSYLNSVDQEYKESKLFPSFSDVLFHYRNLVSLKEKQEFFKDHLPKKMSGVDFENLQLIYEKLKETDNSLLEVEQLIDFSIPKFQLYWEQGKTIFDLVEHDLSKRYGNLKNGKILYKGPEDIKNHRYLKHIDWKLLS